MSPTVSTSAHSSLSPSVVIVGGGFGGLYTALALAGKRQHPPILLIEPNERFLFLPLLYELLSGELRSWEIAPRYDALLAGRGVAWLRDKVQSIDATSSTLQTAGGRTLPFSRLMVATGVPMARPAAEKPCTTWTGCGSWWTPCGSAAPLFSASPWWVQAPAGWNWPASSPTCSTAAP